MAAIAPDGLVKKTILPVYFSAIIISILALVVRTPLLARPGFAPDMMQFVLWGDLAHHAGVGWLYSQRPDGKRIANYPPAYLYILKATAALHDAIAPADEKLGLYSVGEVGNSRTTRVAKRAYVMFKLPATMADAATAALLVIWLSRRFRLRLAALIGGLYALMPAVWHNSVVWGQMDAIPTLFMLLSLEAALRSRVAWMIVWAVVALTFKAQAAMLIPIWAVVCAYRLRQNPRDVCYGLLVSAVLLLMLLWPLRDRLDGVWEAYAGASEYYPYTHLNGFSLWFLLDPLEKSHLGENLHQHYIQDNAPGLLLLPPRLWAMLCVAAVWVYLFVVAWRSRIEDRALFWTARVLPLAFFCLSTQMHERYLFPAVAIWAWAFRPAIDWWLGWIGIAAVAFVNAAWVWPGLGPGVSSSLEKALHIRWFGIYPGVWCAATLGILLVYLVHWRPKTQSA